MLSTPPAFVLSQDQTLVFNPSLAILGSSPRFVPSAEDPQSQVKLISELTVVSLQSLCIVFKILAPLVSSAWIDYHNPSPLSTSFFAFFRFFSMFFKKPNILLSMLFQRSAFTWKCPKANVLSFVFKKNIRSYTRAAFSERVWGKTISATRL